MKYDNVKEHAGIYFVHESQDLGSMYIVYTVFFYTFLGTKKIVAESELPTATTYFQYFISVFSIISA